jgi:hypothetical protein
VATAAVSSAKIAVVDYGEGGRSAVYSRYNNAPRTLPLWYAYIDWGEFFCTVSTFAAMKYDFRIRK